MTGELILFFVLALTALLTALGMLVSRNAVYAALFLVLNFATVAVFYLMLGSPFIALSQGTVYGGAIMVLFLFVVMLLGAENIQAEVNLKKIGPAVMLTVLLIGFIGYLFVTKVPFAGLAADSTLADAAPQPLAFSLFSTYLLPFEITSFLLLVAMIGAIALTKQEKKGTGK